MIGTTSAARRVLRGMTVGAAAIGLIVTAAPLASAAPSVAPTRVPAGYVAAVTAKATPTVSASARAATVGYGSTVTVTGRVSASGRTPTGRVVVNVNGTPRANVVMAWNGTFTASISGLTPGSYTLAARYAGSSTYNARYSSGFRVIVQTLSGTVLQTPATTITYGDTLAVSARVTAKGVRTPAGRVAFYVAGQGFAAANLSNSVAAVTVPVLKPGKYRVDGRYLGGAVIRASVGSRLFTVQRAPSSVDVVLGASTLEPGARGKVSLAVSGPGVAATGTATVLVDGTARASVQLSGGRGAVTLPVIAAGTHSVAVRYAGNTYYNAGVSQSVTLTVKEAFVNGCAASARACVDLTHDLAWLQQNGQIVYGPVPMLSGRPGYRTSTGMFSVYWKDIDHESSIFDSAPMPYSIFFNGGEAFHEGSLSVTSHGCIHLGYTAARVFWDALDYGDSVHVFGYAPY